MFKTKLITAVLATFLVVACSSKDESIQSDGNQSGSVNTSGQSGQTSSIRVGSLSDFQQNIGDRVFFGLDQYSLTYEAKDVLVRQAQWVKRHAVDNMMVIEGHADERGTREYNLALGARRANSVKRFLISQGVPAENIKVVSYGKERPAVEGSNESAWAQNRRGVTTISGISNY